MTDLLALTAELVDIASVSHHEGPLADHLEDELRTVPWLAVERVDDNVVARTELGRPLRLVLAGHTDTVPANGNEVARIEGDTLWGLGATDMKAGLAVALELARTVAEPAVDVTYVFYATEEVEARHNGLGHLFRDRPDLLAGDAAILGEPTAGSIEAGCQGSLRAVATLTGQRAHTARAWMGVNAIHRLGRLLAVLDDYEGRRPVLDGCEYREAMLAVGVEGGVAGNVVPDRASVKVNLRFAPDRSAEEAEAHLREVLAPVLGPDDVVEVLDLAPAAAPGLDHPLLRSLIDRNALEVRSKLGWTDVARFAAHGIPACNFGPGEPTLAHTAQERVERASIESTHAALLDLLELGPS
ncbi:MAG TPA: succinyl-diaminopimelate desuccinylase [Acidimicrobiales bacterium]|nr:succinyl-diaminopimelate desuccinylase [Acidimicrobiales bacterium]